MNDLDYVVEKVLSVIRKDNGKKNNDPYDTGTVKRIDGNIAWVQYDEKNPQLTPVIISGASCKNGDEVRIQNNNGTAFILGNDSNPPTDDTKAEHAQVTAEAADKTAKDAQLVASEAIEDAEHTAQYFWYRDGNDSEAGAHVTEVPQEDFEADPQGGNLLMRSDGIAIRDGDTELARFERDLLEMKAGDRSLALSPNLLDMSGLFKVRVDSSWSSNWEAEEGTAFSSLTPGKSVTTLSETPIAIGNIYVYNVQGDTVPKDYVSYTLSGQTITVDVDSQYTGPTLAYPLIYYFTSKYMGMQFGTYPKDPEDYMFCLGAGSSSDDRRNIFSIGLDGSMRSPLEVPVINITATVGLPVGVNVKRSGQVVSLRIQFRKASTGSAENIYTGKINTVALRPAVVTTGCGYFGAHALIGIIDTAGNIIIRNASSSTVTMSDTQNASVAFTYLVE